MSWQKVTITVKNVECYDRAGLCEAVAKMAKAVELMLELVPEDTVTSYESIQTSVIPIIEKENKEEKE